MHEIYELKEMLCKELEEYGRKGEMSAGTLEIVDKLAHAVKNLGKIIEMDEEGYSGEGNMGNSYARGGSGGGQGGGGSSYRNSYARGRGRYARRDSMGRYSSDEYSMAADDVIGQLESMMETAPDDKSRRKIRELINEMKNV